MQSLPTTTMAYAYGLLQYYSNEGGVDRVFCLLLLVEYFRACVTCRWLGRKSISSYDQYSVKIPVMNKAITTGSIY